MFCPINFDIWDRRTHYQHFSGLASCSYNVTQDINVTSIVTYSKRNKLNFNAIWVYVLSSVVNSITELRMSTNEQGQVGYFKSCDPVYTGFNQQKKIFYTLCTKYSCNFLEFLTNYELTSRLYKDSVEINPQKIHQENVINISSLPWIKYDSFNISLKHDDYLLPIITNSQYSKSDDGSYHLSLSIRVNHKVTDGYHVALFYQMVEKKLLDFD